VKRKNNAVNTVRSVDYLFAMRSIRKTCGAGKTGHFLETTPSILIQSLQNFWLVDGLWHFAQYSRPQFLQGVSLSAFLPQISQVLFF